MVTYDLFHWWLSSVTVWYLSLNIIIITSSSWLWLVWHYFFRSSIHLLPYSELYTLTFLGLPRGLLPVIQELPPPQKGSAQEESRSDAQITSTGSFWRREALLPAPSRCLSSHMKCESSRPCKVNSFWLRISFLVQTQGNPSPQPPQTPPSPGSLPQQLRFEKNRQSCS